MDYHPTPQTYMFILFFLSFYVAYLIRMTSRNLLDLYDFFLLSLVAILPSLFVFFPQIMKFVTNLVGIYFPFILLFGMLFFVVFIFLHRLVTKNTQYERKLVMLVQEVSLLKAKLEKYSKENHHNKSDE